MDGMEDQPSNPVEKMQANFNQKLQLFLDKSTPHGGPRWAGAGVMCFLYAIRVYSIAGFYIVTYALGIYLLHLLIGFLSPKTDIDRWVRSAVFSAFRRCLWSQHSLKLTVLHSTA